MKSDVLGGRENVDAALPWSWAWEADSSSARRAAAATDSLLFIFSSSGSAAHEWSYGKTKDAVRPQNSSPDSPAAASGFHKTVTHPECERQSSITCLMQIDYLLKVSTRCSKTPGKQLNILVMIQDNDARKNVPQTAKLNYMSDKVQISTT